MFTVFNKHDDRSSGKVFYLKMSHWVALQKLPGSNAAVYYDDMVVMKIGNYAATEAVVQLVESLLASEYSRTFRGKPIARRSRCIKT